MSLLHTIVCAALKKNREFYDPACPKDYVQARVNEINAVKGLRIPKSVRIKEGTLGGVKAEWVGRIGNPTDRIVLYIHGGGFVTGSSEARRSLTVHIASKMKRNVVSLDYRLAPEHPFPAAPEDCLAAYRALLELYPPEKIVLLGESAGGNLVLSLLLAIKEAGLPFPAGTFALSPTVQYDTVFPSHRDNLPLDCIVTNLSDEVNDVYLSKNEEARKNPLAAPYYGDYRGCTPVVLFVSDSEVLRDDSLFLFEKLKEQKVPAQLYIRKGMMHTWLILPFFPESKHDLKILETDLNLAFDGMLEGSVRGNDEPIRLDQKENK